MAWPRLNFRYWPKAVCEISLVLADRLTGVPQKRSLRFRFLNNLPKRPVYGVTEIVDMYHSGLEHTLVWVVKTTRPHDLEEFTIELGVARWNDLKFVPERTFADVIRDVTAIHGLQEWAPGDE